jgi:hypothetical protein
MAASSPMSEHLMTPSKINTTKKTASRKKMTKTKMTKTTKTTKTSKTTKSAKGGGSTGDVDHPSKSVRPKTPMSTTEANSLNMATASPTSTSSVTSAVTSDNVLTSEEVEEAEEAEETATMTATTTATATATATVTTTASRKSEQSSPFQETHKSGMRVSDNLQGDEWDDHDPVVSESNSRILVDPSVSKSSRRSKKNRGSDNEDSDEDNFLNAGSSSVFDTPVSNLPWMNPGFALHSAEAEYVNNELKRLVVEEDDHIIVGDEEMSDEEEDDDDDDDDDKLLAKVPHENVELKKGTKLWIQREKDMKRRDRKIQKRLINISQKEHQTKVNQAYESKRRTQLMEDIELGTRIDELLQAQKDSKVAENAKLMLEPNLADLIRGVTKNQKKK